MFMFTYSYHLFSLVRASLDLGVTLASLVHLDLW